MPYSNVLEAEPSSQELLEVESSLHIVTRPCLDSYDSGPECSLDHLRELFKLLEVDDHELDGYVFDDSPLHVA